MWPFMVALLHITLYELKSHAVPQRKSFLALMTGLQLDCTCHAPEGWGLQPGSPSSCCLCVHQSHPSESSPLCVHSPFTPSALPTAVLWRITCKVPVFTASHKFREGRDYSCLFSSHFPCQAQCMAHNRSKFTLINLLTGAVLNPDSALSITVRKREGQEE